MSLILVDRLRHRVDIVWQQTLELSCSYDQFEYLKTYIHFSEFLLESLYKQNYFVLIRIWISISIKINKNCISRKSIVTSMIWTFNIYLLLRKSYDCFMNISWYAISRWWPFMLFCLYFIEQQTFYYWPCPNLRAGNTYVHKYVRTYLFSHATMH